MKQSFTTREKVSDIIIYRIIIISLYSCDLMREGAVCMRRSVKHPIRVLKAMRQKCHTIENAVCNDVLCYISSARDTLSRDSIVPNCVGYYKTEDIVKAKEILFEICEERFITRKVCASQPNPCVAHLNDIVSLFDKKEGENSLLPTFLASGFKSLPPNGFEPIASVLCSLRNEIAAVRFELTEVRESNKRDLKTMDDLACVKQDISDIKIVVNRMSDRSSEVINPLSDNVNNQNNIENVTSYAATLRTNLNENRSNTPENSTVFQTVGRMGNRRTANRLGNGLNIGQNNRRNSRQQNGNTTWQPRSRVVGTRQSAGGGGLVAANQRDLDLFIGGCSLESSEDNITEHCASLDITQKSIEILESKANWYKAYKLTACATDRDKLIIRSHSMARRSNCKEIF